MRTASSIDAELGATRLPRRSDASEAVPSRRRTRPRRRGGLFDPAARRGARRILLQCDLRLPRLLRARPLPRRSQEIALNRFVHPLVPFDMGFRVLDVDRDADLVHVHSHPTRAARPRRAASRVQRGIAATTTTFATTRAGARSRSRPPTRAHASSTAGSVCSIRSFTTTASRSPTPSRAGRARSTCKRAFPTGRSAFSHRASTCPSRRSAAVQRTVTFLFLGRQPKRKGGDAVLEAFGKLHASHPETSPPLRERRAAGADGRSRGEASRGGGRRRRALPRRRRIRESDPRRGLRVHRTWRRRATACRS